MNTVYGLVAEECAEFSWHEPTAPPHKVLTCRRPSSILLPNMSISPSRSSAVDRDILLFVSLAGCSRQDGNRAISALLQFRKKKDFFGGAFKVCGTHGPARVRAYSLTSRQRPAACALIGLARE